MREAETKQEHFLGTEEGSELLLAWSLQYPELGNAVELVTGASCVAVLIRLLCFPNGWNHFLIGNKCVNQDGRKDVQFMCM